MHHRHHINEHAIGLIGWRRQLLCGGEKPGHVARQHGDVQIIVLEHKAMIMPRNAQTATANEKVRNLFRLAERNHRLQDFE